MPDWRLKALLQGAMSLLPRSQYWNGLFQKYVTKSLALTPESFEEKLGQARKHMEHRSSFAPAPAEPFTVVELGTGWHPIVPIALYLCGAETVWTIDLTSLLNRSRVVDSLQRFLEYAGTGQLGVLLPLLNNERIPRLREALARPPGVGPKLMLRALSVEVMVRDARATGLPASSVDLIVSNNTYEHIPPHVLEGIMQEFQRLASGAAVMSHFVDMSDHYTYFDQSITPYNFLKYSPARWRWFNNSIQYQNRLRISDYREIHAASGFVVVHEENDRGSVEVLDQIALAKVFHAYTRDELAVTGTWLVSRPVGQPVNV